MQFLTRLGQVLILVLLFSAVVQTRRVIRATPGIETTGQYMVALKQDTSHERFEAIAEKVRTQSLSSEIHKIEGPFAKVIVTKLSVDEAHKIKDLDNVEFVEEETFAEASLSWALDRIDQVSPVLDGIFEPEGDGEGVDIYILDTGINFNHNEFDGNRAIYPGYDPVDNYYGTNQTGQDCDGHGTHVASLACGKHYGVAKKANCYSVRTVHCSGPTPWNIIIDGLNYAATNIINKTPHSPAVISMSLRGPYSSLINNISSNIINMGIPIVAAAGNEGDYACNYSPANAPGVITVAGSAPGDEVFFITNGGFCIDIFAPGYNVTGAGYWCDTCTLRLSGTSMATPLVSGAIALYLQNQPLLTPSDIMQNLTENCLKNVLNYCNLHAILRDTTPNCLLHITTNATIKPSPIDTTKQPLPTPSVSQGSCLALNLSYSGCCVRSLLKSCSNDGCFCDQHCHKWNDCCSDIGDIGCHPISSFFPSPTPKDKLGSCSALKLSYSGCCNWSLSNKCDNNGCYCDQSCHQWNDCCDDIADIGCYSN